MLARALRLIHLTELFVLAAMAWWLATHREWSVWGSVLMAVAVWAGWRIGGNALVYVASCIVDLKRPIQHRTRGMQRIALVLREGWVFTAAYAWYQWWPGVYGRETGYLSGHVRARHPVPQADLAKLSVHDRPVVLLVHGYLCNAGVWAWFVRWFEAAGMTAQTVSLEPVLGSIEASAIALHARLDELRSAAPERSIVLVCHSMGGLVTRACFAGNGLRNVTHVVTLGTPHRGTVIARLGLGVNACQMRASGRWIESAPGADMARSIAVTTIMTHDDNLVSPRMNATLPGARNIELAGIGHLSLLASRRIFDLVCEVIAPNDRQR